MPTEDTLSVMAGPLVGALLALVCLLFAMRSGKRRQLVVDLPTSKTTGVFIGLVELKGTAEAEHPLTSYLAGQPCVHYAWSVEEHWSRTVTETYTDSEGHTKTRTRHESGWTTVAQGSESTDFYLKDDCGVILVRPEGARIEPESIFRQTCSPSDPMYYGKGPAGAVADSDHSRLFQERAVPLHAALYVMGRARERQDIVAPEIARDPHAEMFLISTRSEEEVGSSLRLGFWGLGMLGLVFAVAGWVVRTYMLEPNPVLDPIRSLRRNPTVDYAEWIVAGSVYLSVWLLGWVWMMYNSLVALRERVVQAWSNVDVQLKRRNDLIPNLLEVTKGLRDYERSLQTELAQLRQQLTATPPGEKGPDPAACAGSLKAIVERYPELKANESFFKLQQSLTDTENRIAMARGYFNDIAMFYNTHLEQVPDRYIAALAGMRPRSLMTADQFERQPVRVELADVG